MKKTDLRGAPERRSLSGKFEMRAADSGTLTLTGYASVFNSPYDIMGGPPFGFREIVDPKAFDKTLRGNPDLHLLINHEGMPLARTKSGTLQLSTDSKGLVVNASLDRQDPDVQRLERKMTRGDIDEMSFAFRTIRDQWDDDEQERRLLEVSLDKGDVSVVNFGANPATSTELHRALRALSAPEAVLTGAQAMEARRVIGRLLAREAVSKSGGSRRALDAEDVNMLTQAMGWFTAIDNITDGVVEDDPEFAGVDLAGLITAIDAIADEAQEAIATYLGVASPDPDDMDGDEPVRKLSPVGPVRKVPVAPARRKTSGRMSVADAMKLIAGS